MTGKLFLCAHQVVEAADVVIQVLDARDPLGSRCPQVEEAVLSSSTKKRLVLLLNKIGVSSMSATASFWCFLDKCARVEIVTYGLLVVGTDLVPKENVEGWLKYLRNEFPTIAFKASTQTQKENLVSC